MAYTVKIRTQPGAPMLCEYECPECGRFERTVNRDENGDPPASVLCGEEIQIGWVDHPRTGERCRDLARCEEQAELVVSAANIKFWSRDPVAIGRASKSDEKDPRALDTEPLATGKMTKAEWKKYQHGITLERRYQKRLKAGKISKRIQVGGG